MELKIYDKQGNVKMTVSPDNSSQWNHEVGVENVITVNFTTWEFFVVPVGWYILVNGLKFRIKSEYRPKHIHNTKYTYNLKFYGREHDMQDILFCRLNQGDNDLESVFAYDGTPSDLLAKVVANMNRNTDGTVWKVGEAIASNRQTINFNGLYCWDAIGEIARVFNTEWWIDGEYLNLSKCVRGESVSLGYGQGLKSGLTQNENTNAIKWFTRLIPVGSSKNIDKNKYGYTNLQLPGRESYIDINTQYGLKEYREEAAFGEIFPHRVGTISSVRSEVKSNDETGEFTVYYVKDASLPFNPDDYMIGGAVINMTFNSGVLAGKEFEVNWNNESAEFEIINQYPDDATQLPGSNLIPSVGNQYVLSNISMPDEYNRAAEEEYQQAVDAYLAEYSKDVSIYTGNTDYIYIDKNGISLMIGQRVSLISDIYFESGMRESRITRISRKLNNLNEASIDCSDAISSSWKSGVDSSLNQLQFSVAKEIATSVIDILKSGDPGQPSDYNVLSSLRSIQSFLSKKGDDSTPYSLGIGKDLSVGGKVIGDMNVEKDVNVGKNLDVNGTANIESNTSVGGQFSVEQKSTAKKGIQIGESFVPGILTGIGGNIDEHGNAELESLVLRRFLEVPELKYNRTIITVGNQWNAPGGGVIERVETSTNTAWMKLENGEPGAIAVGDICMGIFHSENASENANTTTDDSRGNFHFAGFYTCYFTITEITDYTDEEGNVHHNGQFKYQLRPASERWKLQYHPSAAMSFVCYGSFTNAIRQKSIYQSLAYIRMLKNQNTWEISKENIGMQLGDMENMSVHGTDMSQYSMMVENIYLSGIIRQVKSDGTPVLTANDKGTYVSGTTYDYYDRVSYDGSLWLCVNEIGTNTVPSKGDASWLLQVEAGVGISSAGAWKTENTPYKANTIVTFAESVWISNKETSAAPYSIYTDKQGNRLTYKGGGYILVTPLVQSSDWDLLLAAPDLTKGEDGKSIEVRYSSDKTNWHGTFVDGDLWMQQRVGSTGTWSAAMRIVGEAGANGYDGVYAQFEFAVNTSESSAPTSGWQDAPPNVGIGQFLWMRQRIFNPNTNTATSWVVARIKGDTGQDGEGYTTMGQWRSGMVVPKMGVVTMGGSVFVAKVETSNPPLWTYTDNDGKRLTFKGGGYILTGELNTQEYDQWVEKPKDGAEGPQGPKGEQGSKGDKGDKGDTGAQGIQGCIVRDSEWVIGVEYHNDEALTSGTRYIDVALVRENSAATGWRAYKCQRTHMSNTSNAPGNTTYWEEFSANFTAIFTSLVISKNAKITFLQGNQLLIQEDDGTVTAGMSGSNDGGKFRFWAGSAAPDNAPFRVNKEGEFWATKANVEGNIYAGSISLKTLRNGGNMEGYTFGQGTGTYTLPSPAPFKQVYVFGKFPPYEVGETLYVTASGKSQLASYNTNTMTLNLMTTMRLGMSVMYLLTCMPAPEPTSSLEYIWVVSKMELEQNRIG